MVPEIGMRVNGEIQGQQFTGTVAATFYKEGTLYAVDVKTDNGLTTPARRTVYRASITGEGLSRLVALQD